MQKSVSPGKMFHMSIILKSLLILVLAYLGIILFFYLMQTRMLFLPRKDSRGTPADMGLAYRDVFFEAADGVRLHGWFTGAENDTKKPVILICHGNAGNITYRLETLALFHHLGLRSFIFDYRGFGKSDGEVSEDGTYLDAAAAWQYLTQNEKIPHGKIILFGRSLGGGIASHLAAASNINAAGLILESTFTSVPDVGGQMYPWLPVRLFSRFDYDTMKRLPGIHLPLLVVHSPDDEVVPYSHGKKLFAAANEPKHFLTIKGLHNDGFLDSKEIYVDGLNVFISNLSK